MSTPPGQPEEESGSRSEAEEEQPPAGEGGGGAGSWGAVLPPTEEPTPAQLAEGPAVEEPVTPSPEPELESEPGPEPELELEPEPEPVVPVSESSHRQAPGAGAPLGAPAGSAEPAQRPEVLAGAAFAGGLVLAMLLRRVLS